MVTLAMKLKDTPWKKSYNQPRQHIQKQRHYFANKSPSGQGYGFSSGHVWLWELDYKESWAPKNWCFWTVALEKTLESPLDCKEIEPVHPKGNQSWIFTGRTDAEAETPILWPLCTPKTGGLGSIPGQRTRSYMLQVRVCMPQLKQSLHAAAGTWHSQKKFFFNVFVTCNQRILLMIQGRRLKEEKPW